ncbi:MAG: lactate utilization protein C [Rhizobiaceae bacterium]
MKKPVLSGREAVLKKVRAALGVTQGDVVRRAAVEDRIALTPLGVMPARGQLPLVERTELFVKMAQTLAATVDRVTKPEDVPRAIVEYLRQRNLPAAVRMGDDRRLQRMPWSRHRALEVRTGRADPDDEVGVSHALRAIAETGTVVLESGPANPTTVNFLPEHHIVVVDVEDIAGDMEAVFAKVRKKHGKGRMPRVVNLISGPSRSGDVEQKIVLGAHGPRALHLIVVGG